MNTLNKTLRILMVEDSEDDVMLALRALRRGGFEVAHRRVQTAAEMTSALADGRWDAVLSDYNMPGFSGMTALEVFHAAALDIRSSSSPARSVRNRRGGDGRCQRLHHEVQSGASRRISERETRPSAAPKPIAPARRELA
jgi:hypothetical protein